jgi:predicted TIM-barrel fold metal-dependent hydrolase
MPADYTKLSNNHLVLDTIYMEAEWHPTSGLDEVKWIHSLHQQFGQPVSMVAQAWLDSNEIENYLASISNYSLVKAVRHKPVSCSIDEYSPQHTLSGSMRCSEWEKGYALLEKFNLMFELQTPWWHLPDLLPLLEKYQNIKVVLNHAGVPGDRNDSTLSGWYHNLSLVAQYPNVFIKISGIGEKDHPWTLERNEKVIKDVIKLFGTDRVMFASNFPVDSLCVDYNHLFNCFKQITSGHSKEERLAMFYLNSKKLYQSE